jgi:hypothetical protein
MARMDPQSLPRRDDVLDPAAQLLADILTTGYTVEEFVAHLRVDSLADTIELPPVLELWTYPAVVSVTDVARAETGPRTPCSDLSSFGPGDTPGTSRRWASPSPRHRCMKR